MTTLVLTDTHCPFMHDDAVAFLKAVANQYNPDHVVHGGDVADMHFASRFSKSSHNNSEQELDQAIEQLQGLSTLFPNVKVCYGNHDNRLFDRMEESNLPRRALKSMNAILGLPKGWKWQDEWIIDGVVYEHGEQYGGQTAHIKAASANMMPTVVGHVHAHAGTHYVASRRASIWGMNAGCLINKKTYAFHYAKKQCKPVIGCGIVVRAVPLFLPMKLNDSGRWTGKF